MPALFTSAVLQAFDAGYDTASEDLDSRARGTFLRISFISSCSMTLASQIDCFLFQRRSCTATRRLKQSYTPSDSKLNILPITLSLHLR
jgi:hypothetical protein